MDSLEDLLQRQDGVIARRQVFAAGGTQTFVARKLRRRDWATVHPGVYVSHTGPLTWTQRAWAAVLAGGTAALDGWSAVRAHEGPGRRRLDDDRPIEIVVRSGHRPARLEGVLVRESRNFSESVQLDLHPPRLRYDDAIILLAECATDELRRVSILAEACGGRRTTAARLLTTTEQMSRLTHRRLIVGALDDIAEGTCSVLEHAYLTKVERAHGLPHGLRQVTDQDSAGRRIYRDIVYGGKRPPWRQYVELDGRLGHDTTLDRDRDFERDLDAALECTDTVRLGYGQVLGRPCSTARKIGRLLQLRGWDGVPTTCPDCDRQRSRQPG